MHGDAHNKRECWHRKGIDQAIPLPGSGKIPLDPPQTNRRSNTAGTLRTGDAGSFGEAGDQLQQDQTETPR